MLGTPTGNRVLLKANAVLDKTDSGIIIKTVDNVYFDNWKVVSIGPDVKDVKVDDIVYIDFSKLKNIPGRSLMVNPNDPYERKQMIFVHEDWITAVLEN